MTLSKPPRRPTPHRSPFVERVGAGSAAGPEAKAIAKRSPYRDEDLQTIAFVARQYLDNGGLRLAWVLFEGLVEVAPQDAAFAHDLAVTYDKLGAHEEAKALYLRAATLDPTNARPLVQLAQLLVLAGKPRAALRRLQQAIQVCTPQQVELKSQASHMEAALRKRTRT